VLDLHCVAGRDKMLQLISAADIVIESSRPRALQQLGIDAQAMVAQHRRKVWISLTGYGRSQPEANWVAFGDDAAVAAGVFTLDANGAPLFCGDALCDPLAGLHAAVAAQALWRMGKGGLLDINLRDVAAHCRSFYTSSDPGVVSGDALARPWRLTTQGQSFPVQAPTARASGDIAAAFGADSERVLQQHGIPC
jgi:crotonobetainyl-CoA:carnitine CoA-transferase CaiB-like acyl-CoA transferase